MNVLTASHFYPLILKPQIVSTIDYLKALIHSIGNNQKTRFWLTSDLY